MGGLTGTGPAISMSKWKSPLAVFVIWPKTTSWNAGALNLASPTGSKTVLIWADTGPAVDRIAARRVIALGAMCLERVNMMRTPCV
jgi:hypothetical protein